MVPAKVLMLTACSIFAPWVAIAGGPIGPVPPIVGGSTVMPPYELLAAMDAAMNAKTWTPGDLNAVARDKAMVAAVPFLTGGADGLDRAELKAVIDRATRAEIQTAILGQAWSDADPSLSSPSSSDKMAKFGHFFGPAYDTEGSTCETADSAGFGGLEECVARCENKKTMLSRRKTPPEGACYALCSLAVAPCGLRPFMWRRWWKEGFAMIGDSAMAVATRSVSVYTRFSGLILLQALCRLLGRHLFDSARVPILLLILFVVSVSSAANARRYRAIQARYQRERRGWALAVSREAIIAEVVCARALIVSVMERRDSNRRPTQVLFHGRRREIAARNR